MKKIIIALLAFCSFSMAFAQTIPNAGFEEWTDNTHPIGWNSSFSAIIPFNYMQMPITVIIDYNSANRTTNAHSGEAAVEIIPQSGDAVMSGMTLYTIDVPGIVQLGQFNTEAIHNIDFNNFDINNFDITQFAYGGIACNLLPERVTAWVNYSTIGDSLRAGVIATRWNNGQRQTVAQGEYIHQGAISEYTQIEIPVSVCEGMNGIEPDTVNIIFSNGSRSIDTATRLYLDDVELYASAVTPGEDTTDQEDTTAIFSISTLPVFSVQPNPATDVITILPLDGSEYALRMYDTNGKLVRELYGLQNETRLDVNSLTKGVYFLQVKQGTNVRTQKVIIR